MLFDSQFTQLNHDPTDKFERKLQRFIKKLKQKLPLNIYSKIYSSGSCLGKFYGTAKIHKMSPNDSVQHLPIRPIVSNIGTATYHMSKYLASLWSPLSKSEYTVKNLKSFVWVGKSRSFQTLKPSINPHSILTNTVIVRFYRIITPVVVSTCKCHKKYSPDLNSSHVFPNSNGINY